MASADVDFLPVDILIESVDYEFETFSQEFQLKSDDGGDVRWMLGAYYMDEDIVNDRSVLFRDTAGIRNVVNTLLAIQGAPNITQVAGLIGTSTIQQIAALPGATQAAAGFDNPAAPGTGLFVDANGDPVGAAGALTHPAFAANVSGLVGTFTGTSLTDSWFVAGQGIQDTDFNVNTETLQLYGQMDWDITEELTIDVTVAYIDDKKTVVSDVDIIDPFAALPLAANPATVGLTAIQFFRPFPNYPNATEDGVFTSSDVTTSTKLIYSLDDDTNVYASYSTGFKPISISISTDPAVYAGQAFDNSRYYAAA